MVSMVQRLERVRCSATLLRPLLPPSPLLLGRAELGCCKQVEVSCLRRRTGSSRMVWQGVFAGQCTRANVLRPAGTRQRSEWLGPSAAPPWPLLPPSLPINAVLGCSMDLYLISSIPCGISCLLSVPVRASLQDVCLIPELRNNVCLHLSEEFSPNLIPRICASCVPLSCIHRVSPIMPGSVPHPRLLRLLVRPQQQERHHCQQQQREHGHRQR